MGRDGQSCIIDAGGKRILKIRDGVGLGLSVPIRLRTSSGSSVLNLSTIPNVSSHFLQEKLAAYADENKDILERQRALQHALLEKEQKRDRIKHLFINGHIGPDEMEQSYRVVDQE